MIVRRIGLSIILFLIAGLAVSNAGVDAIATTNPNAAARLWSGHPAVERSLAMTKIARATRAGQPVSPSVFRTMADAAVKDPLAAEPFLVRGVQAQLAGDGSAAQRAFEAAQWRDPRSLPAAYFLADRYFRAGDVRNGLIEVAALARLSPNGALTVGPYLAEYAASPANWPALRTVFRSNPGLADITLVTLASNVATIPAVEALADPAKRDALWMPPLLATLVGAGDYARAYHFWAEAAGVRGRPGELLHDATFADRISPPPFNWDLTSSSVGLAERQAGGRLHILFYGQEDGILADQLLLLSPGSYRMSMRLLGDSAHARALNWSVWCDKAAAPVASVRLDAAAASGWVFTVPPGCPAQWLKLSGVSSDMPQQSDLTIAALKLERVSSRE